MDLTLMDLLLELFITAFVTISCSLFIAKLASIAMVDDPVDGLSKIVEEEMVMEEQKFDRGLEFESTQSESRVQFVVKEVYADVNQFEVEASFDDSEESCCREEFGEKASHVVGLWPDVVDVFDELIEGRTNPDIDELNDEGMDERVEELGYVDEKGEIEDESNEMNGKWSDDDDWEGIERSELEKDFIAAANYVAVGGNNDLLSNLQLYGLQKVAIEGPCHEAQPIALKVSARAKWNAWQRLGNLSPEIAMEKYISLLSTKDPQWGQNDC